jgi:hypothetical protein
MKYVKDRRALLSGIILEISQETEEAHFWSLFLSNSKELISFLIWQGTLSLATAFE